MLFLIPNLSFSTIKTLNYWDLPFDIFLKMAGPSENNELIYVYISKF